MLRRLPDRAQARLDWLAVFIVYALVGACMMFCFLA